MSNAATSDYLIISKPMLQSGVEDEGSFSDSIVRTLVQRLQQVRLSRHLSQQEVYNDTGVHIGRLEAKPVKVTMRTLIILCRYYDVPLAALFADL